MRSAASAMPAAPVASEISAVFDLRALAARQSFGAIAADAHGLPLKRATIDLGDAPIACGVALIGAGAGEAHQRENLFLTVMAGTLALDATVVAAGESVVLPRGSRVAWRCSSDVRVVFQSYAGAADERQSAVPVDRHAVLVPSGAPSAALLTTPTPQCRNHSDFKSSDGVWTVGIWDSTPYTRRAMTYAHYELMHLLDGAVTIGDGTREHTFGPDSIFLVRRGAACTWSNLDTVRKVYAIHRPLA